MKEAMLDNLPVKRGIAACAISVVAVAIALSGIVGRRAGKARPDDVVLGQPSNFADPAPTPPNAVAPPPLASIPWKRDCETFVSSTINSAQLPWLRSADQPTAVACSLAELPWARTVPASPSVESSSIAQVRIDVAALPWDERHVNAFTPVDLPTIELPWRY